jgi:sugar/nucleoside kinase (ribokinase family)
VNPGGPNGLIDSALRLLGKAGADWSPVVAGFDGFVDEMITPVAERQSLEEFSAVPDIASFGALVTAAAGHSSLREIVVNDIDPGGCAVNLGDGLAALGVPVDCFATLGEPPHPAFAAVTDRFRSTHSWGREPGRTLAFEFSDGKLMYSAVRQLQEFTAEDVQRRLSDGSYFAACRQARLIALTDWTLYPHMTGVWQLLLQEVFSRLPHRPDFFFDLVDPSSRADPDIRAMLATLSGFEACGPVTLGLNGNEANILARLTGLPPAEAGEREAERLAVALRERLGLSSVVIHRNKYAVGAVAGETARVTGPHCANPRKSTGAGDRFNAGYILGMLGGGSPADRLVLGCATAGYFVRAARSATRTELTDFLQSWKQGVLT